MPFGLCNAPATFQLMMNTILRDGLDRFVLVFLDDILIYSYTREEYEQHIHAVLDRLKAEKFFGCVKKCDFYQTVVEYLGIDVGAYGVKPSLMWSGRSHSGDAPHRLGTPHSEAQAVHSGSNNKNII